MGDFRNLKVWRKAHALSLTALRLSRAIRGSERSALRNQLTRSAMSIPTNIVEGTARRNDREFARFLRIALGSASELEYHLIVAHDTECITHAEYASLQGELVEVRKMLSILLRRLTAESNHAPAPTLPVAPSATRRKRSPQAAEAGDSPDSQSSVTSTPS